MIEPESSPWHHSKRLAQAIVRQRDERRKWLVYLLLVPVLMLAAGIWGITGWLQESPLRFLLWWGACGGFTCLVLIFALYDAVAVMREERSKRP